MKKTVMIVALAVASLFAPKETKAQYSIDMSPRVVALVGGVGFVTAGLLQSRDKVWVSSPTSININSYGQPGYWRYEKIWESPGRAAATVTGVLLLSCALVIEF